MKKTYLIFFFIKEKIHSFFLHSIYNNNFLYKLFIKIIIKIYSKKKTFNNFDFFPLTININKFSYCNIRIYDIKIRDYIPNWHYDYLYNYKFDNSLFYKKKNKLKRKADIKVPWEISRLQFLFFFGLLYRTKKEEKYYN